jgi:hypothetical protein
MSLQTLPSPAVLGAKSELNLYQKEWCGDNEVIKLSKMLLGNKKLSFLGFRNCKRVGDKGAQAIAKCLASERGPSELRKLVFEFTQVGDLGAAALAHSIRARPNSKLGRLDFGYCKVGDTGAAKLAEAIAVNPPFLKTLVLDYCKSITDAGATALLAALDRNTHLTILGIKGTATSANMKKAMEMKLTRAAIARRAAQERVSH